MNHRNDRKEHHQQCSKWQRFFKGMPQTVFFHDTGKSRGEHDDRKADQADFGPVKGKRHHQK